MNELKCERNTHLEIYRVKGSHILSKVAEVRLTLCRTLSMCSRLVISVRQALRDGTLASFHRVKMFLFEMIMLYIALFVEDGLQ